MKKRKTKESKIDERPFAVVNRDEVCLSLGNRWIFIHFKGDPKLMAKQISDAVRAREDEAFGRGYRAGKTIERLNRTKP